MTRQEFAYNAWGKDQTRPAAFRTTPRIQGFGPKVIFTADDFGRTHEIDAAVARAHRDGLLTAASLMVAGGAFDEAVAIAREMPTLAVGLHLVVVDGRSTLPRQEIPHLVNDRGEFRKNAFRAGVHYAINRSAQRELAREIRAQFERFMETRLPLSHVDGHLHMHAHPSILEIVISLAEEFGAFGIRVPIEPLSEALLGPARTGPKARTVHRCRLARA